MTLITWPLTSDGSGAVSYTANQWRTIVSALFTEGVLGGGSFIVSQRALGANMTLDIAAGVGVLSGDNASTQGNYVVREDLASASAVTIGAANASNPRYDLVGIQLRDPSAGGAAGRDSVFSVVAGTAASSPSAPAVPDSFLLLATVLVGAGVVSIVNANVVDGRVASGLANQVVGTSAIVDGAVTNVKLANNSVDNDKIAASSVDSAQYVDGSIDTAHLSAGAVTNVKLANNSVDNDKIAASSVDSAQYVDGSIDAEHLSSGSVTNTKIGTNAVSEEKIGALAVSTRTLASSSVTDAKVGAPSTTSFVIGAQTVHLTKFGHIVTAVYSGGPTAQTTYANAVPSGWRPARTTNLLTGQSSSLAAVTSAGTIVTDVAYLSGSWSTI